MKPENSFIASVGRHFPSSTEPHREKMSNPYTSGTADMWYSGKRDLWVEYKYILVPARDDTLIDLVKGKSPELSVLQQHWLEGRHKEGRQVRVIVGSKDGGVILKYPFWMQPISAKAFRASMMTRKEIAEAIVLLLGGV